MKPGERRPFMLRLQPGADFTADDIEASTDRDISVAVLADGNLIGGMTYRLDPAITRPYNGRPGTRDCTDAAKAMLDCLGVPGQDVKSARIKEVVVGFKMKGGDCC